MEDNRMDFMDLFDWIIVALLVFCIIALFSGHADFVLNLFRNKAEKGQPLPYEKKKFSITMGILCVIMLIGEMIYIFIPSVPLVIASLVVLVVSFVVAIWYLRKYAKVEVPKNEKKTKKIISNNKRKN